MSKTDNVSAVVKFQYGTQPNSSFQLSLWAKALCACAVMAAAPIASAQSNQDLNSQIQQLKEQLNRLQDQVEASKSAPAVAAVAAPKSDWTPVTSKGPTLNMGGLKLTIGGFLAGESVYRTRNETADIASSYTAYPFQNSANYYTHEFRETGRQSRVQMLVQGPEDGVNRVEGFIASDFLSSGTTSNSNESNSYTLRVREAYADYKRTDYGIYVLAGQTWSMATMFKQGLTPRTENVPLTIDAQYVPGFNWLRTPEFRVVKEFGKKAAVGIALDTPQNLFKGTAPSGATAGNTGGSLLNSTATYSTDIAPDVIVKAAFDPGYGHYEVYSLTRFFRDRSENTPGKLNTTTNQTTIAESIGAGTILPLIPKKLDFQVSGLIGHGNGRYGSATLGDSTFNTNDGSPSALKERQILVGLVGHPTPRLDLYTYAGMEHDGSASGYGYGNGVGDNSACNVNVIDQAGLPAVGGKPAGCSNTGVATVRQATGGMWYKFYKGPIGYMTAGAQVSYTNLETYSDKAGIEGKTNDTTYLLSFRYYPYQ